MRRKAGNLVALEAEIVNAGLEWAVAGRPEFHGFQLAKELKEHKGASLFTATGTLYRALDRLEGMGFLTSRWEEAEIAAKEGRPRRCYYEVTPAGAAALASYEAIRAGQTVVVARSMATS